MPWSCTSRWSAAITSSAPCGSSWEVGSSSTRIRGPAARADAIATRWRSPPESVRTLRSRRPATSSRSRVSSTRRRMCAGSTPRFSIPYASSSSTRSSTNEAPGSCGTNATTSASRRGGCASVSRPSTETRPAKVPPVNCGTSPFAARSKVDFPDPVGPTASANDPSSITRSTESIAGRDPSGYVKVTSSKRSASLTAGSVRRTQARPAGRSRRAGAGPLPAT